MTQATDSVRRRTRLRESPQTVADRNHPVGPDRHAGGARGSPNGGRPPSQVRAQRRSLLALQARLQGSVTQAVDTVLNGHHVEETSASPDVADCAGETVEQNLALSLLGTTEGTLNQVEAALQKIEEGGYGRCEECGVDIPAARLEAVPYATRCVPCAARREAAAAE
jgi:DnaK suppressor protein